MVHRRRTVRRGTGICRTTSGSGGLRRGAESLAYQKNEMFEVSGGRCSVSVARSCGQLLRRREVAGSYIAGILTPTAEDRRDNGVEETLQLSSSPYRVDGGRDTIPGERGGWYCIRCLEARSGAEGQVDVVAFNDMEQGKLEDGGDGLGREANFAEVGLRNW